MRANTIHTRNASNYVVGLLTLLLCSNVWHVMAQTALENYVARVNGIKYKLRIAANGIRLEAARVVPAAKFCVGQRIILSAGPEQAVTGATVNGTQWSLPPKYVNAVEYVFGYDVYARSCYPGTSWLVRGLGNDSPQRSDRYFVAPVLLTSIDTGAWWYSSGTKLLSCYMTLTFANGQQRSYTGRGQMQLHRPTISISDIRPRFFTLTPEVLGFYKLKLGQEDNTGAMIFSVDYNSQFRGKGRITQLCSLNYSGLGPSFSDYRRDGSESYEEADIIPGTAQTSLTFQDGPFNTDTLPNRLQGYFVDYIRFCPDAGSGNIFVTLGIINWNMNATAASSTTISPSSTPNPTGPNDSDVFPVWDYSYP